MIDIEIFDVSRLENVDKGKLVNNVIRHLCNSTEGEDIVSCIERESFDLRDVIKYQGKGKHFHVTRMNDIVVEQSWTPDFSFVRTGLCRVYQNMDHFGEDMTKDVINIGLNPNIWYLTFIYDPKFFIFSRNPGMHVNSKFQAMGQLLFHKLKMVEHQNIDVPYKPCETSPSYSFTNCVNEAVSKEVIHKII